MEEFIPSRKPHPFGRRDYPSFPPISLPTTIVSVQAPYADVGAEPLSNALSYGPSYLSQRETPM